jgi:hypothetical protein
MLPKRFSYLLDALPDSFQGVAFNPSFRTALSYFRILGEDLDDNEKGEKILRLFFGDNVPNDEGVGRFILEFITAKSVEELEEEKIKRKKDFDFDFDSGRILASFIEAYGIDLTKTDLHWWVFLQLLNALPEETIFRKVIDIRNRKTTGNLKDDMKLIEAQQAFALPDDIDDDDGSSLFGG